MLIDLAIYGLSTMLLYEIIDRSNIADKIIRMYNRRKAVPCTDTILDLGYNDEQDNITVDMSIDAHMIIAGLSQCGKSRLAESCLQNKPVTILNAFTKDFKTLKGNRINGKLNILEYLEHALDNRTEESPIHYILIDEILVLMRDKKINEALANLLAEARHYGIYVIALTQNGTKEVLKCKDLFNVRVAMKQIEEASYRTILGCTPPNLKLYQREFYVVDEHGLRKGHTHAVREGEN